MILRRALARLGVLTVVLAVAVAARAEDTTGRAPIPAYHGYVNDEAHVLSEQRAAQLESFLDQVHQKTGAQFAILTVASCEPEDPSAYKTRVFNEWHIGDKDRDDGLLLLVAMKERDIKFETGYGLEGTLPDGWQSRMLRDLALPEFRNGDPAAGITAAVLSASQRIAAEKGVKLEWNGKELRYDDDGGGAIPWWVIKLILIALFILVPAIMRATYGSRRGWYSGWGGGGWGGGFGGFGGGFGGGGFSSGGSFGGFGGGSSGGGGGGAHW